VSHTADRTRLCMPACPFVTAPLVSQSVGNTLQVAVRCRHGCRGCCADRRGAVHCAVLAASARRLLHDCVHNKFTTKTRQRDHFTMCSRRGVTSCGTGGRCARQQSSSCTAKSTSASTSSSGACQREGAPPMTDFRLTIRSASSMPEEALDWRAAADAVHCTPHACIRRLAVAMKARGCGISVPCIAIQL
jgi:hypothetical protein